MGQMGNGEMSGEDGHGIAEDQVVLPVEDGLLPFGKVVWAEEAGPLLDGVFPYLGKSALHPSRIVLEAD
jgi:hypothetical protein